MNIRTWVISLLICMCLCFSFSFPWYMGVFGPMGKHRLKVFKSSVLRSIFGLKRDEVTGRC
jgi:hypothetical protein